MKRTEIERKERDLKRMEKKITRLNRIKSRGFEEGEEVTVGECINKLFDCFQYDDTEIYNLEDNDDILNLLVTMDSTFSEKEVDGILRKAIKKTKIEKKEESFKTLKGLLS